MTHTIAQEMEQDAFMGTGTSKKMEKKFHVLLDISLYSDIIRV